MMKLTAQNTAWAADGTRDRISPDPPIGVTLRQVVCGSEHEKSLVMQEN